MYRITLPALAASLLLPIAACSNSGTNTPAANVDHGAFQFLHSDPVSGATVYLNDPIRIDFTNPVDLDSASLTTVTFQALDQLGNPLQELVVGNFLTSHRPGDDADAPRRSLQFVPQFASNDDYLDGGFRPGRTYLVRLIGSDGQNPTVLHDQRGKALERGHTFAFMTKEGTQPAQLYRNPKSGGPTRTGLSVTSAPSLDAVPLGLFGAPPLEVRLDFDQALNPARANVPVALDTNPLVIDQSQRGRIYLEYDDPVLGANRWIPAAADLERNDLAGATIALRPIGVLPNNATIRVIVERTLEDIAGESNAGLESYDRVFGTFRTEQSFAQQWNAIVDDFESLGNLDLAAAFPESQAEVGPGYLKAGFAFDGNQTSLEYEPIANEIVLNTAFTQIVPKAGLPFTVTGGVFNFRNVTIPQGVTVIGQGPNPMVWLCNGKFTVAGTLTVRGGHGARVDTLQSANFAKAGGIGSCGGGNGGDGTPKATLRDVRGGHGRGPMQASGKGGRGGYLACLSGCLGFGGGSGGGGGTLATQGDPHWRGSGNPLNPNVAPTANTSFQQKRGYGGAGCNGPSGNRNQFLLGGEPGDRVFTDSRTDNDFWGSGIDVQRGLRITGELPLPIGGGGGGGGGDAAWEANCLASGPNPANDFSGGGGGAGGGVLIIKALDEITILSTGNINANGGHGGGGEQTGNCSSGGGGGGGAGGMVVLMSAKAIRLEAHGAATLTPPRFVYGAAAGTPFQGNDYSFAVSADGGACLSGAVGTDKYPISGAAMIPGSSYDTLPLGALGGMGIVQLMVPPGENLTDGTNTRLDDNIHFHMPGTLSQPVPGLPMNDVAKRALLAWRGFPNAAGVMVDDNGLPTNIGDNEGDIRPAPTLLPVPFGARSRARSKWIDTGASRRRQVLAEDPQPRGLLMQPGVVSGPRFVFAGLHLDGQRPGYVAYASVGANAVAIDYPTAVQPVAVERIEAGASFLGQPAYRVRLAQPALTEPDRYVAYEAELLDPANSTLASFRILSHDQRELLLAIGTDLLPTTAASLRIRAKFFKVVTNGSEGLGRTYSPGAATPIANVRIGFAFHRDPHHTPFLGGRYPSTNEQDFVHRMDDPGLLAWINSAANPDGPGVFPRYVQWDVQFDMAFQPTSTPAPVLQPDTPRPELHYLRLPFRF